MIERVISGGQSGSDQAAWRAARRYAIPTGGYMPAGFLTEAGPRPEFAEQYGAEVMATAGYPARTLANVNLADVVVWFGATDSPGGKLTLRFWCVRHPPDSPPILVRTIDDLDHGATATADVIRRTREQLGRDVTLLVAGNRESRAPGIGRLVENYLCKVFRGLGFVEGAGGVAADGGR